MVALLSRMPIGMVGLSMLMFLREALGSYAFAGSISGVYFVAMAVGAPIQGRLIDRSGPKLTLLVTGIVHPLSLLAVIAAAAQRASSARSAPGNARTVTPSTAARPSSRGAPACTTNT